MKDIYIVDRLEGEYAVCDKAGEMYNLKLCELPDDIVEGDFLMFKNNKFEKDEKLKQKYIDKLKDRFNKLWK
jgi:hypothetical protein